MSVYLDAKTSLLAYCKKFLDRNNFGTFETFDFDTHASIQSMPDSDLLGVADYAISNQGDTYNVTCMIMVCTRSDDTYLKRLTAVVDSLFGELRPGFTNHDLKLITRDGLDQGELTVLPEVQVLGVATTSTRPVQAISLSFGLGYFDLPN